MSATLPSWHNYSMWIVDVASEWRSGGIVDSIFKSPALSFFIEKTLFMEHQTRELDHRNYRSRFTR